MRETVWTVDTLPEFIILALVIAAMSLGFCFVLWLMFGDRR